MEHMYSLLFLFSHLGCLFLLLRERSAESRRIIRMVKFKDDFKMHLLCCAWPSDHICQDSCCFAAWTNHLQWALLREGNNFSSIYVVSFSISKWFKGASLRLKNCWGGVAVKSAFLAFCLSTSGALTSLCSLQMSRRSQCRGFEHKALRELLSSAKVRCVWGAYNAASYNAKFSCTLGMFFHPQGTR